MFVVKSKTSGAIICQLTDVEQALVAEGGGLQVQAIGRSDIQALAEARCESSPDYNRLPDEGEEWVKYTSKGGRMMICEVIRMCHPDSEGYPQLLELVHKSRPDTSFMGTADRCEALDLDSMSPELVKALTSGDDELDPEEPRNRLSKGLRR